MIIEVLAKFDYGLDYLYFEPVELENIKNDEVLIGFRVVRIMGLVTDGIK